MRLTIFILSAALLLPSISLASKWNDFQTIADVNGMELSYHSREQKDGWFIEWRASNNGSEWGQPVSKSRTYTCDDGKQVKIDKAGNFGPLPPGENRKMIRDQGICLGGIIGKAEIDFEVREVSEKVKKMYE